MAIGKILTLAVGLVALGILSGACEESDVPTPIADNQPDISPPIETAFYIPETGLDDEISASGSPQILDLSFPETVQSDIESAMGEIWFYDDEGDVHSIQFTLAEGGCMDFEYSAFDPMRTLKSGDRIKGSSLFQQTCVKCPDSLSDPITMRVQIYDHAGNESEPYEYSFVCE